MASLEAKCKTDAGKLLTATTGTEIMACSVHFWILWWMPLLGFCCAWAQYQDINNNTSLYKRSSMDFRTA